jgi:protein ImuA
MHLVADAPAALQGLRRAIAEIEGNPCSLNGGGQALAFGVDTIDAALGGGLAFGALHELSPAMPSCLGPVTGFALTLAARISGSKQVLLIQPAFAGCEAGSLYAPGLALFGLPLRRVLMLRVTRPIEVLWAMEEALKCPAVACVIAELPNDGSIADLTATRRLTLAAREGDGFGLMCRHRPSPFASAAETRWEIAAAESHPDRFGGLGRAAFSLSLTKNRRGPTGRWTVAWDHHDRVFSALPLGVVEKAVDRSRRTPLARAG